MLVFGIFSTAAQWGFQWSVRDHMSQALLGVQGQLQQMEELSEKLPGMQPDEADQAISGMMDAMGNGMMESSARMHMLRVVAPYLGVLLLFMFALYACMGTYFLLFGLKRSPDARVLFSQTAAKVIPLVGVWFWTILRSFMWIPVLGALFPPLLLVLIPAAFVLGLVYIPRLMLAPVILLEQGKGVRESVALSMERSKGSWGKIVGNMLVVSLLLFAVGLVLGIATSRLVAVSPVFHGLLGAFISTILFAYKTTFYASLSQGILANPRM
jgi:hypothetical protein